MATESKVTVPLTGERAVLMHLPKCKPIDITFKDIRYRVESGFFHKTRKEVLRGVSGRFLSGELTAIMGPSGAGKSTLLNVLSGFNKEGMSGKILCNGVTSKKGNNESCGLNTKESCYILQDDQLSPLFTVLEIMNMACALKIGSHLSSKERKLVIDDILEVIGLSGTKYTRCGQLSGGQKKRLSIALELIDNPAVMFLDEPTTGLDSSSTLQLVNILKSLARGGRTIVCTIHQPSATIFEMFDHMYVINDGRCVYQGTATNIVPFLQSIGLPCPQYHNPSDFMLDVVSGEFGDFTQQLIDASRNTSWRGPPPVTLASINGNAKWDADEVVPEVRPPSEWAKLRVLLKRCAIQLYRDWTVTHLKMILHFCVGILLGYNFTNAGINGSQSINNVGYFMCTTVYLSYTSIMPAILKFPSELNVLRKEQFNNWYKLRTYYFAFLATNLPVQVILCTTHVTVSYYLSTQILDWKRYVMFLVVNQLSVLISECMGLSLGTAVNPINGLFTGAILFAVFLLFAGFLALFNHMPVILRYVSYLSFMRYTMEGMVIAVYGYGREQLNCPEQEMYCHYRTSTAIFEEIGMSNIGITKDVVALCVIFLISCTYAYISLRNRVKKR